MSAAPTVGRVDRNSTRGVLSAILAGARDALGCAAVIVTQCSGSEPETVIAADGVSGSALKKACRAITALHLGRSPQPLDLTAGGDEASRQLGRLGYDAYLAVTLEADGARVGTLHVLAHAARGPLDVPLAEAFAAHCGAAIRHRRQRRRILTATDQLRRDEAFDGLALATETTEDLIPLIETAMATTIGQVMVGVMVWDTDRRVLQMISGSFGAPESVTASYQIDPEDLHSNAARVFELQWPYLSNHAAGDRGILQDYVEVFGIDRLLSLPLIVAGRPTGVLHVANKATDFTGADLSEAERLVPRIALAVESTRMRMRLRMQQQIEGALSDVAVAIASGAATETFLPQALEHLRQLSRASIVTLVPTASDPVIVKDGIIPAAREQKLLKEARGVRGERRSVIRPTKAGDPGAAEVHVPVRLGRRRVGTLSALRSRSESFAADERRGFARLASLIALAWASERYQQQRAALARLEERQRIADDLHDDVAQILFAAQMHLDAVLEIEAVSQEAHDRARLARSLLIRGDTVIRNLISRLSRPAATSVAERLTEIVDSVEQEFMVPVHLEVSSDAAVAAGRARRPVGELVLRVARESLVNAAKHAGQCRISATLDVPAPDRLRLRVVDDGIGLSPQAESHHHGLTSMRRIARTHDGRLQVRRGKAGGTTVSLSVPVDGGAPDARLAVPTRLTT